MAKKDKKSKKQVDDSWENDVETAPDNSAANKEEETPAPVSAPTKKGKKNKKQVDDSWENDIETAADPVDDKEEEAPAPVAAPSKKGKKNKKQVDDSWENDIETASPAADSPADSGNATPTGADTHAGPQAPTEVTEIDDDDFGPIKKGKKGGKQAAAPASPKEEPEEEEETGGRVKTKKEKEKEKKEREKQRKKEQAARKKATEPAEKAAPAEEKKVEAAPVAEKPAAKDDKKGGKSKVPSGVAAALRKKLELQQKQAAELARIEEEERQRIEDEERAIREEEERKEQARLRKKEKEQAKKEELKKQGKYMTPAQKKAEKERLAKAAVRIEQMKAAGMTIEGLDSASTESAPKKPSFDKKKKKGGLSKAEQEAKAAEERKKKEEADRSAAEAKAAEEAKKAAEAAEAANAEEDVLSSWEEAVDDDVKDSWDQDSDEEKAPEAVTKEETKQEKGEESEGEEDSDDSDDDSSDEEEVKLTVAQRQEIQRKEDAAARRKKELEEAKKNASTDDLRSPICCILGHVDTGKTKLLDKIRQTNVQEGEAGGITQQIGATYFPSTAIKEKTRVVDPKNEMEFKAPGLLIIDTPGHESFTNLRSRGSSLCNIAILVVDIMHGLEPQTLESIRLLRAKKTPFIVALNKIDRLYGWKSKSDNGFLLSLAKQKKSVQAEFRDRLDKTILAFAEQGLNSVLFSENKNMAKYVSLVPTSAHTGEGIPDMLKLLIDLTQQRMAEKLMYISSLECTVLEVKVIEGLGTTIDVILSNGVLREGDRIVLCGLNGAISTTVRALLTPQPMKELRVKAAYVHHKEIKAAMGIKIAANDLESAIAGSRLVVVGSEDNEEDIKEEVMRDLDDLLSKISTSGVGVAVQASTLGALEALLEFLRTSNIPVCTISIGPVSRRDVLRAGAMLEKHKEFAVMLCFDVKIEKEAQAYADEVGVKIFSAEIIYHLFDMFTAYQDNIRAQERLANAHKAVFPCILKTNSVFNSKDPILLGVDIVEGSLRIGTPLAVVVAGKTIKLGRVTGIELNHKPMKIAKKGSPAVAVKIEGPDQPLMGRQVAEDAQVVSLIDRESIDVLRRLFREEVTKEEWMLIARFFKKLFDIPDPTKQAEPTKQVDAKAL